MVSLFKSYSRSIDYLLPPSIMEWLPKDHLAYFVVDIIEKLDLSEIKKSYSYGELRHILLKFLLACCFMVI
jgi:hypothetical protein